MKVLVSDNLGEAGIRLFKNQAEIDVDVKIGLDPKALKAIITDYDALVIRSSTKVTRDLLESANKLKVVGRAGIGVDNVDIIEATKRGIIVMNTPGANAVTTAEHTVAMMMALTRNIPQATASMKSGRWNNKMPLGQEIFAKVLGVIGFGKVGSIVANRARGLKMRVIVYDPYVTPELIEKAGYESVSLKELYQISDYITIHVPKLKETNNMINKTSFGEMKRGVMIINCARGGLLNEMDLQDAILSGKVSGAALDVFETEPPGKHPLFKLDRVICTPHLGASTKEAQVNVAVAIAHQIIDYLKTGSIVNAVNGPSITGELLKKLGPYLTLGEQIGSLQAQLFSGPLKEISITYAGDFQSLDLSPVSTAIIKSMLTSIVKEDVNLVNAKIIAKERGIKISETISCESEDYINLITVKIVSTEMDNTVAGTIFGKSDSRIVRINSFRLEMNPRGHLALIYNRDVPGSIGEIGTTLGRFNINIGRMQVGQEEEGERNIIFLCTDTRIPGDAIEALRKLETVKTVVPLEF